MTSKQEEIKKGLFDILNNCPKDKCENDDPDTCIRCDVNRVVAYLSGKDLMKTDKRLPLLTPVELEE